MEREIGWALELHSQPFPRDSPRSLQSPPTPLSGRAALNLGGLPNVYGSKLFRITDC